MNSEVINNINDSEKWSYKAVDGYEGLFLY